MASTEPVGRGRPKIGNEVLVRIGDLLPRIDEYATDESITRAEAIRQLLGDGLDTSRVRAGQWLTAQEIAFEVRHHGTKIPHELRRRIIEAGEADNLELEIVYAQSLRRNGGSDVRLDLIRRKVGLPRVEGDDSYSREWVEIYEVAYKAFFADPTGLEGTLYTGWRKLFTDRAEAAEFYDEAAEEKMGPHPFYSSSPAADGRA